jgi:hypothetical protein
MNKSAFLKLSISMVIFGSIGFFSKSLCQNKNIPLSEALEN